MPLSHKEKAAYVGYFILVFSLPLMMLSWAGGILFLAAGFGVGLIGAAVWVFNGGLEGVFKL